MINFIYTVIFLCIFSTAAISQDIVDDVSSPISSLREGELFNETIRIISQSRKIFILTNNNENLSKGDFITLALDNKPITRALVAKNHGNLVGIKILKILTLKGWAKLRKDADIQIARGDDSFLFKKEKPKEEKVEEVTKIETEEDLYNEKEIDLGEFDENSRHIKPDNLVAASWSQLELKNTDESTIASSQWFFQWGYQFADNIWAEASYGRTKISDFPSTSIQTLVNNFTVRAKYTFKLPLYSYLMPYIGFQMVTTSSPDAGNVEAKDSTDEDQVADAKDASEEEEDLVNDLSAQNVIVGVTLLRRLVPGWFVKVDLGIDAVNVGVSIEF